MRWIPLAALLILLGCFDAPPPETAGPVVSEAQILGKWSGPRPVAGEKAVYLYDIQPKGALVLTTAIEGKIPQAATGSWQLDGHRIKILAAGQFDQGWITVSVEGNTLTLGTHPFRRTP